MLDRVPHQDKVVGSIKYGMQRGSCDQEMSEKRSVSADSEHDPDADAKKRNNRKERILFFYLCYCLYTCHSLAKLRPRSSLRPQKVHWV